MKFVWLIAIMMTASCFALETYECKDLADYDSKDTYYIVKIGTLERTSFTEYDDKNVCEKDAAKMEARERENSTRTTSNEGGWENEPSKGWRENDGTLLWEKRFDGGYYCYDKTGMKVTKRVKETKYCK